MFKNEGVCSTCWKYIRYVEQEFCRAWEAITRFDGQTASVNILLNRCSPWLTVESFLPYEGKVRLRKRQASHLRLRMPNFLDPKDVLVRRNGWTEIAAFNGLWLEIAGAGDVVELKFSAR